MALGKNPLSELNETIGYIFNLLTGQPGAVETFLTGFVEGLIVQVYKLIIKPILLTTYGTTKDFLVRTPIPSSNSFGVSLDSNSAELFEVSIQLSRELFQPLGIILCATTLGFVYFVDSIDNFPAISIGSQKVKKRLAIAPIIIVLWIPIATLVLFISAGFTDLFASTLTVDLSSLGSSQNPLYDSASGGFSYADILDAPSDSTTSGLKSISVATGSLFNGIIAVLVLLVGYMLAIGRLLALSLTFALGPLAIYMWCIDLEIVSLSSTGSTIIQYFVGLSLFPVAAQAIVKIIPVLFISLGAILNGSGAGGAVTFLSPLMILLVPILVTLLPWALVIETRKVKNAAKTATAAGAGGAAGLVSETLQTGKEAGKKTDEKLKEKTGFSVSDTASSVSDAASKTVEGTRAEKPASIAAGAGGLAASAASSAPGAALNAVAGNDMIEGNVIGDVASGAASYNREYFDKESRDERRAKAKNAVDKAKDATTKDEDIEDVADSVDDMNEDVVDAIESEIAFLAEQLEEEELEDSALAEEYMEAKGIDPTYRDVDEVIDEEEVMRWAYGQGLDGEMSQMNDNAQTEFARKTKSTSYDDMEMVEGENGNKLTEDVDSDIKIAGQEVYDGNTGSIAQALEGVDEHDDITYTEMMTGMTEEELERQAVDAGERLDHDQVVSSNNDLTSVVDAETQMMADAIDKDNDLVEEFVQRSSNSHDISDVDNPAIQALAVTDAYRKLMNGNEDELNKEEMEAFEELQQEVNYHELNTNTNRSGNTYADEYGVDKDDIDVNGVDVYDDEDGSVITALMGEHDEMSHAEFATEFESNSAVVDSNGEDVNIDIELDAEFDSSVDEEKLRDNASDVMDTIGNLQDKHMVELIKGNLKADGLIEKARDSGSNDETDVELLSGVLASGVTEMLEQRTSDMDLTDESQARVSNEGAQEALDGQKIQSELTTSLEEEVNSMIEGNGIKFNKMIHTAEVKDAVKNSDRPIYALQKAANDKSSNVNAGDVSQFAKQMKKNLQNP